MLGTAEGLSEPGCGTSRFDPRKPFRCGHGRIAAGNFRVVVAGAGVSGLYMAETLKRAGIHSTGYTNELSMVAADFTRANNLYDKARSRRIRYPSRRDR